MSWDISLKQPGTGVPEIMRRFLSLCDVITTCHTRGVVHRDLKPSNILVDVHGLVRVLDFGIANLTRPSEPTATAEWVVTGTPGYMAPEQYFGQPSRLASPAADVYSLGMLLLVSLRTLAGARDGELPTCLRVSPDPDRLCAEIGSAWTLAPILAKCLQLEPNNRWPDAGALASALREWELVPGLCSRDDVVRRGLWSRKFWLITSSAVAAVLVLGGMYQSVKGRFGKAARPEQSKSATPERIPSTNQPLAKPHSLPRGFD
jgi:serine/threonine protein kinase